MSIALDVIDSMIRDTAAAANEAIVFNPNLEDMAGLWGMDLRLEILQQVKKEVMRAEQRW